MKRFTRMAWVLPAMLILTGCGAFVPGASPSGASMQADGLFGPSLPPDRPLAPEERSGDFDVFLHLATREATRWDAKARLTGAQATNVDRLGRKAGGTQYAYTFSQGRKAMTITVAGNNLSFERARVGTPLPITAYLSAPQVLQAALDSGRVDGEAFQLLLAMPASGSNPVFLVAELKQAGRRVLVEAQSGQVLPPATPTR
ncbi:MAG TPA: hypothetical protein V6D05_02575 [Stenomitos sp.]